jgi:hypothetical protein
MKNSIIYLLVLMLCIVSCKEQPKETIIETAKDELISKTRSVIDRTNCFASQQIYPQTAWVWSQTWVSAYNYLNPSFPPTSSSPELFFKGKDLSDFKAENATGVLLYYILFNDRETIPSLAMINTSGCEIIKCNGKCVLISRYDPGKLFSDEDNYITYKAFEKYQKIWVDSDKEGDAYALVKGYNYTWVKLKKLSETGAGIRVKYGARTIEASEEEEYGIENSAITGNIIACNVLIGWVREESFEDALRASSHEDLDFAKPCPEYCGQEQ